MDARGQPTMSLAGLRLLVAGLMAGVLALLVIALIVNPPREGALALDQIQTLWLGVLLALAAGSIGLVVVLSRVLVERSAANARGAEVDEHALAADFTTLTVIRCAVVEGVGLLGAVVYLIADLGAALMVTLASLVGLARLFPSAGRFAAFRDRVTRPE